MDHVITDQPQSPTAALADQRDTPLGRIPVAYADAVTHRILRVEAEQQTVDVAAFGSSI